MTCPTGQLAYGDSAYWDDRYKKDTASFDWYQQYSGLAPLLHKYIAKNSRILMAGCGTALLSEDMIAHGYQEIINIDISSVVIGAMQKKHQDISQLKYMTMDVRDLSFFRDGQFDSVIDKGTLDSLMCGTNAASSVAKMIKEVIRVLKPGGIYMLITYGQPRVRMPHLNAEDISWRVTLHVIPKSGGESPWISTDPVSLKEDYFLPSDFILPESDIHYVYVCTKVQEDAVKDFDA